MTDERISLSKLSQLSPSDKMKDPMKIPLGKEPPRKKKGKKSSLASAPEAGSGREDEREEKKPPVASGRVVDILV